MSTLDDFPTTLPTETGPMVLPSHPFLESTKREVMFQTTFEDKPTNVIVTTYTNTIMITVTQNNRLGTILKATRDRPAAVTGTDNGTFTVQTLLGRRDDVMYIALARRLARLITDVVDKTVILAISLSPQPKSSPSTDGIALRTKPESSTVPSKQVTSESEEKRISPSPSPHPQPLQKENESSVDDVGSRFLAYTALVNEIVEKGLKEFKVPAL